MSDRIEVNHERVDRMTAYAQLAQAAEEARLVAWRKDRDRERRRLYARDALQDAMYALRWMMLGAALVLTSVVQTAAVGLAVAVMRPCVDDSGINCSVTAPNGTQFASVHIGNHLIIMVHNDRP